VPRKPHQRSQPAKLIEVARIEVDQRDRVAEDRGGGIRESGTISRGGREQPAALFLGVYFDRVGCRRPPSTPPRDVIAHRRLP
jgi:hypothetical protein